ncbi:hypothetical protein JD844_008037, partial [Phrynosoma platyrhinos]
QVTRSSGPDGSVTQTAQQCRLAFTKLLQKIQGLPAALLALPLELTVLYNSLLFDLHLSSSSDEELLTLIDHGLSRVLEACPVSDQSVCSEERWERILQERIPEELQASLHQLAALQAALWLAGNRLEAVEGLFRILSGAMDLGPSPYPGSQNELLLLLQTWHPCDMEGSAPLVAQSLQDLKEMLWTSAAFLQGKAGGERLGKDSLRRQPSSSCLEKGKSSHVITSFKFLNTWNREESLKWVPIHHPSRARHRDRQAFSPASHASLHSKGKPQVAMQHLRQALQVDFTFLPALYQAALLYRQLGLLEAELESLTLLYQALDGPVQVTRESVHSHFLIRTEHLIHSSRLNPFFVQKCPSGVKYLLAQRANEAAEHYLDLLAMLQEGPRQQKTGIVDFACLGPGGLFLNASSVLSLLGGSCNNSIEEEGEQMGLPEVKVLPQIRQLALTGRGAQFLELGQEKKALMDFQHSLHICSDSPSTNLYFLHTLWKLGRRQEAAAHWQKSLPKSALMDEMAEGSFPLYLQSCVRQMKFPHVESLTSNMERFLEGNSQEP